MRLGAHWVAAIVMAVLGASCGSEDEGTGASTAVWTKDFAKACAADGECVAVYEGNACSGCQCPNAAIAQSELKSYQRELGFAEGRCSNSPPCDADCTAVAVRCEGGECVVAR